jgi:hypothetical protein
MHKIVSFGSISMTFRVLQLCVWTFCHFIREDISAVKHTSYSTMLKDRNSVKCDFNSFPQSYALIIQFLPLPCFFPTVRPVLGHNLFLYSSMAHTHTLLPTQGHGSFQLHDNILLLLPPLNAVSHILFPNCSS